MKTNQRVVFPPGRPAKEEAVIEVNAFKMIKNTETVIFIPATPKSELRKKLQELDDMIKKPLIALQQGS